MVISGIPYYYASGVFRVDEKGIMIKTLIRHCIVEEVQTAPRIKRVYELLITDYRIQREPDEINLYPKHWINCIIEFYIDLCYITGRCVGNHAPLLYTTI